METKTNKHVYKQLFTDERRPQQPGFQNPICGCSSSTRHQTCHGAFPRRNFINCQRNVWLAHWSNDRTLILTRLLPAVYWKTPLLKKSVQFTDVLTLILFRMNSVCEVFWGSGRTVITDNNKLLLIIIKENVITWIVPSGRFGCFGCVLIV